MSSPALALRNPAAVPDIASARLGTGAPRWTAGPPNRLSACGCALAARLNGAVQGGDAGFSASTLVARAGGVGGEGSGHRLGRLTSTF